MKSTHTTEGEIPHLRVIVFGGVIFAPVKLALTPNSYGHLRVEISEDAPSHQRFPTPMRRDGKLVFALPGGGEILG